MSQKCLTYKLWVSSPPSYHVYLDPNFTIIFEEKKQHLLCNICYSCILKYAIVTLNNCMFKHSKKTIS